MPKFKLTLGGKNQMQNDLMIQPDDNPMTKKGLKSAPIDTKVQVSPSARLHEYMKQASDDEDVEFMKFEDSESDHE